jgi:hypothetical protein
MRLVSGNERGERTRKGGVAPGWRGWYAQFPDNVRFYGIVAAILLAAVLFLRWL